MILEEIVSHKRLEVERRKSELPISEMRAHLADAPPPRGFKARLSTLNTQPSTPNIIAEIKKGSPSRGIIRFDFDPEAIAKSYERNGAAAPLRSKLAAIAAGSKSNRMMPRDGDPFLISAMIRGVES